MFLIYSGSEFPILFSRRQATLLSAGQFLCILNKVFNVLIGPRLGNPVSGKHFSSLFSYRLIGNNLQ